MSTRNRARSCTHCRRQIWQSTIDKNWIHYHNGNVLCRPGAGTGVTAEPS